MCLAYSLVACDQGEVDTSPAQLKSSNHRLSLTDEEQLENREDEETEENIECAEEEDHVDNVDHEEEGVED